MTQDLIFNTNSLFDNVTYYTETESWCFFFEEKISVSFSGFWRLYKNNKIVLVSTDNGQQYGLPEPIDLVSEITKALTGKTLQQIKADKDTADLELKITEEIKIIFYTSSTGYENYYLAIDNKTYIGMGGGGVELIVPTEEPNVWKSITVE
jgi:hypothetical protein